MTAATFLALVNRFRAELARQAAAAAAALAAWRAGAPDAHALLETWEQARQQWLATGDQCFAAYLDLQAAWKRTPRDAAVIRERAAVSNLWQGALDDARAAFQQVLAS